MKNGLRISRNNLGTLTAFSQKTVNKNETIQKKIMATKETAMASKARQLLKDAIVSLATDCPSIVDGSVSLHLLSICGGLNNDTFDTCMTDTFLEKMLGKTGEDITFFRHACIHFREEFQKLNVATIAHGKGVRFIERV
jgi:hypothetical protein